MTAPELKDLLNHTGVKPVEVALDQGIDPSVVSNYMRGIREIPDEFVARLVCFVADRTRERAEYAQEARKRFSLLVATL